LELPNELREHFNSIEKTLESKTYIETGWPSYGLLPYLIDRFRGRIKIVHLYRHPAKVASSLTTHDVYSRGEWTDKMSLSPSDYGVAQSHLSGDKWDRMDEFSKCLFWWTEINNYALDLRKKYTNIPWFDLRFEEAFSSQSSETLENLTYFLELPVRTEFLYSTKEKVDRFSGKTSHSIDIGQIQKYDKAQIVMSQLKYNLSPADDKEISRRYKKRVLVTVREKINRLVKKNISFLLGS